MVYWLATRCYYGVMDYAGAEAVRGSEVGVDGSESVAVAEALR